MKIQDHYDWIVLGDHPAALLSASLAARLGVSVLILPMTPSMGAWVSPLGHHFDPESNYVIGLGQSKNFDGLISSCLTKLGILPAEKLLIETVGSSPQVLTPDNRLAFISQEMLQNEFHREFGKLATQQLGLVGALQAVEAEFISFWYQLPKRLTLNPNRKPTSEEPMTLGHLRTKLSKTLDSNDPAVAKWFSRRKRLSDVSLSIPVLREVFAGLWYGITLGVNENPTLFELLQALSLSRTGGLFKGGMTAYREFLIHLARRQGVHVPLKTECRRIFVENGRFIGVQVTGHGNRVAAGGGILGCSLSQMDSRTVFSGRQWLSRKKKSLIPSGWKFTVALTVHQEAVPSKLLARSVWREKGSPILEIEVVHPDVQTEGKQSAYRVIYLRTVMPFSDESLKIEYQRLIASRMTRQLMEIVPFLEFHVTHIYPDFRTGGGSRAASFGLMGDSPEPVQTDELLELYSFRRLDSIPDNLLVYQGKGLGSTSGIDHLRIASDESYPELGNLGSTLAALESVAWLAHRSGLAGPFV